MSGEKEQLIKIGTSIDELKVTNNVMVDMLKALTRQLESLDRSVSKNCKVKFKLAQSGPKAQGSQSDDHAYGMTGDDKGHSNPEVIFGQRRTKAWFMDSLTTTRSSLSMMQREDLQVEFRAISDS